MTIFFLLLLLLGTKETEAELEKLIKNSTAAIKKEANKVNITSKEEQKVEEKELLNTVAKGLIEQNAFEEKLYEKVTELSDALNFQKQDYWSIQCGISVENGKKQRSHITIHSTLL